MKDVIKSIFEKYGVDSIRPAIIVFGDVASARLNFQQEGMDLNDLKQRIENLPRNTGTPDLNQALSLAKTLFARARAHAKKVIVVISDDRSDSKSWEITTKARELEEEEIEVVSVGVAGEVDPQQLKAATPHKNNVIVATKDDDVADLADKIVNIMLKSKSLA